MGRGGERCDMSGNTIETMKTKDFTLGTFTSHLLSVKNKIKKAAANVPELGVSFFILFFFFFDRFKVEQKLDFKEPLHSLNVTELFNGGCDLSGITGRLRAVWECSCSFVFLVLH